MTGSKVYPVQAGFAEKAHCNREQYDKMYAASVADPEGFWAHPLVRGRHAERQRLLPRPPPRHARRPDRHHLGRRRPRGPTRSTSPTASCTSRSAASPTDASLGVKKGDRVCIYLPMIVEAAVAMLACARIGAIHSVVFGGFSPDSLAGRIQDCDSKLLITADEGLRGGRKVPLKANADEALRATSSTRSPTWWSSSAPAARSAGGRPRPSGTRNWSPTQPPECPPAEMGARTRCSSSTPPAPPASRRACCTPPAATWCGPRSPMSYVFDYRPARSTGAPPMSAGSPATPTSSTARSPTAPPR
jgi:acetyl-CoA synthetase